MYGDSLCKLIITLLCTVMLPKISLASNIYMATNGNDSNDGFSYSHPVATLKRAIELATTHPDTAKSETRILVQPGTYRNQTVAIEGNNLKGRLIIMGQSEKPVDFPIFLGDGSVKNWLKVKSSNGRVTGLTIQALQIRNYFTAISLEGNRDDTNAYNSGTIIRRNIFSNIGSIASISDEPGSTAAIRFFNSKNNLVEFNSFTSIRNRKGCGALHAIYVAHFSSGNRVINNNFDDVCGSVIKLRDRSNDNFIENNKFSNTENSPGIEEWFCDMQARKDCTKKLGECPSTGNIQRNNFLNNSGKAGMVSVLGNSEKRTWCSAEDFSRDRIIN